ncbi:hypothetical protein ACLB2K_050392 [Fragaria x ananassa]
MLLHKFLAFLLVDMSHTTILVNEIEFQEGDAELDQVFETENDEAEGEVKRLQHGAGDEVGDIGNWVGQGRAP